MNNSVSRDKKILKRLVESYGKNDVLKFVRSLNENSKFGFYTSLDLVDLGLGENDPYGRKYEAALDAISSPYTAALKKYGYNEKIGCDDTNIDEDDVRKNGYFYLAPTEDTDFSYAPLLDLIDYNDVAYDVRLVIRVDKKGGVEPGVIIADVDTNEADWYFVDVKTPDEFAAKFDKLRKTMESAGAGNIDATVRRIFNVISYEKTY